ncbi:MAG: hypothetical protein QW334_00160 [Thermofilum sp.]
MSVKDLKMVAASDIVKNPEQELEGRVRTIYDQALAYPRFDNLEKALNILAEKGWRVRAMAVFESRKGLEAHMAYVIVEREK